MPWPSASLRFAVLFLAATVGPPGALGGENVGCLFSETLCEEETEWCYNDFAFGRCLQATGDNDEEDLYRYNLEREELHELSHELRRLFALGYRWSHAYTQCRLQAMLYAERNDLTFDSNACSHLVDQDLEGALKALESEGELDPREVAIVKFTPSDSNPNANFADEIYYPPIEESRTNELNALRETILPSNAVDVMDMPDPYAEYEVIKRTWIPQMHRRSIPDSQIFSGEYNTPGNFRLGKETRDLAFLPQVEASIPDEEISDEEERSDENEAIRTAINILQQLNVRPEEVKEFFESGRYDRFLWLIRKFEENEKLHDTDVQSLVDSYYRKFFNSPERFYVNYNTPENFRAGRESKDDPLYTNMGLSEPRIYFDEEDDVGFLPDDYGSGFSRDSEEIFRELKNAHDVYRQRFVGMPELSRNDKEYDDNIRQAVRQSPSYLETNDLPKEVSDDVEIGQPAMYTEGGMVYAPNARHEDGTPSTGTSLWETNFGRLLEKLNLGFKRPERLDVKKPGPRFDDINIPSYKSFDRPSRDNYRSDILLPSVIKKKPRGAHPNPMREIFDVDENYVYVTFKNMLSTWSEGNQIIKNITNLLDIEPAAVSHGRVDRNEVTFKVGFNRQGLNATDVAKKIDSIKDKLKEATGVEIVSAGVGDKIKTESVISVPAEAPSDQYIVIFMVCGIVGALIVGSLLLIIIRRHIASREKLSGLACPETEASKDYQDLCRARMATKGQQPAGESVHGRITSLSRESEQSPSSRSSTSSWSEEPALHNMDISTGHMVLSYMEDHLKNKDRLEQEWVALCAYVAEPCETSIALKKENIDKNRYPDVLPYDHSRVVLNELSNANGSDYINASSITDHDPRNPAYIATQGPLPHTAPDFWQLIWEQGAVVIVMLTRLTEGGAAMCHRYWPEEGSELYHIYEVHLVSEHIWCDDYLVRSFYLKNTRTGETRTVTQFHFLSWSEANVPASTKALLEFRRKVNKSYRGRSCPIVVHCSDGAGRTGTYCLIDMVLSRMAKGAKEIDIAATLEHLRDQRPRMVATKQQFEFVLTAVAEEVHAILKALPPQPVQQQQQQEKEKQ